MIELIRIIPGPIFLITYMILSCIVFSIAVYITTVDEKVISYNEKLSFFELLIFMYYDSPIIVQNFTVLNLFKKGALKIENNHNTPCLKRVTSYRSRRNDLERSILEYFNSEKPLNNLEVNCFKEELEILTNRLKKELKSRKFLQNLDNYQGLKRKYLCLAILLLTPGFIKLILGFINNKPVLFLLVLLTIVIIAFLKNIPKNPKERTNSGLKYIRTYKFSDEVREDPILSVMVRDIGQIKQYPEIAIFKNIIRTRFIESDIHSLYIDDTKSKSASGRSSYWGDSNDCNSCSSCGGCGGCGGD